LLVQQFFINGIAHSSYLLGGKRTCAIIDPSRDVQVYIEAANSQDMKITHILETHLHADFVFGHLDLAELTGAKVYASKSAGYEFDHIGLKDGDVVIIMNSHESHMNLNIKKLAALSNSPLIFIDCWNLYDKNKIAHYKNIIYSSVGIY